MPDVIDDDGLYRLVTMLARAVATSACDAACIGCGTFPRALTSMLSSVGLGFEALVDVIPAVGHVSIPRAKRGQRPRPAVRVHTVEQPPGRSEVTTVHGVPVTTPGRSIVDSLKAGTQPEQIGMAIRQALDRGLTTPRRLRRAADGRSSRVPGFIDSALATVGP